MSIDWYTPEQKKKIADGFRPVIKRILEKKLGEWLAPNEIVSIVRTACPETSVEAICITLIDMTEAGEIRHAVLNDYDWKIPHFSVDPAKTIEGWWKANNPPCRQPELFV